jgi:acyl transferase domain-containing protein/NAD(P)H-dependent flavin oxidoreductase YrpB (nitropropane dioxygenase family)/NAD(P)-dependent dehydrogenase (short-subunit alcohol dehydrogenase family)
MAIDTARAGGVGVLDAVHLRPGQFDAADANLRRCVDRAPADSEPLVGLRVAPRQLPELGAWLDALAARPHWIVLADWSAEDLPRVLEGLAIDGRQVWLEVGGPAALGRVDASLPFHGWAGCGAECGGLAGTESSFVLAQRLARLNRPFIVRGGIGVHAAAACAVAGAHAVVLDDVLHLMRESAMPPRWRHLIGRLGLTDTARVGADLGRAIRVLHRPDAHASRALIDAADRLSHELPADARAQWASVVDAHLGWDEPEHAAWPIGEGIALARDTASQYRTIGALVHAVEAVTTSHVQPAASQRPLGDGAPLAAALGTRFPILQGPMTRVSDTVAFASAVSAGGALPLLALALMRGPEVNRLLSSAREGLGDAPWGVGILGFVPAELWREQLAVVEQARPPFALIAGGRPEQVSELESAGIATFLHVPAPLLQPFLRQGVRRVVFEGSECGGHIGPLHSFTLWEYAVDTLVSHAGSGDRSGTQVIFAGGIHDDLSAAMVAALATPLSARDIQIGVLMGTAYLFTEEAIACGAITPAFQREAIASDHTVTIETGPGHVIRCAATPFSETFASERRSLARSGLAGEALSATLDQLIVGRSRVASKGLERVGDRLVNVDEDRQRADGLYMLGEVAALQGGTTTIARLHRVVSSGSSDRLSDACGPIVAPVESVAPPAPADVAIVGASCLVPGANDIDSFWRNLLEGRGAITEIPAARWDWRLFYDERPGARDRIVSKWGGFVDPIPFDPLRFGIPPKSLHAITPPQLLALELTRRALADAGFEDARPAPAVRERTSVVFAIGNTADLEQLYMTRATLPLVVGPLDEAVRNRLPEWTEESYPGLLPSVTAGRVANRFDFGGANLTIDAACASSFAALDVAVSELVGGRSDLVVCGGLEFEMSPQAFMGFSHTRALSPSGRASVFDTSADGIVISEGGVVVVLKRLADAVRDGDRIYAVVKSVAASSDGRGLSMTAPKPAGQRLALTRAYQRAGIDPATIRMYEAHATGTELGDAAEAESISRLLEEAEGRPESCAIGSAKSLIGHTRTAAGMVALLKVALSLRHRVLAPHAGVVAPLSPVAGGDRPLYLLGEPQPWMSEDELPRRAGASAFGFGGTNYHVVVEEYRPDAGDAPLGADAWPCEVFVLAAEDEAGLLRSLDRLDRAAERLRSMPSHGETPAPVTLRDLAYVAAVEARRGGRYRAAIVSASADALQRGIASARQLVSGESKSAPDVFVGHGDLDGGTAWLFPGQGSQYPGMGRELAAYLPELRAAVAAAARHVPGIGAPLDHLMWPRAAFSDDDREGQQERLAHTAAAQPAIGAMSCGLLDVMRRLRLEPTAVAGHSFGEFVALHAAGCLDRESLLALAAARGRAMASVGADAGAMAVIARSDLEVMPFLEGVPNVVIANRNAPNQVVISGAEAGVRLVIDRIRSQGHTASLLTVSGAFHSPLMRPARAALGAAIASTTFRPAVVPVYGNANGRPYPIEPSAIAARLQAHLEEPVDFVAQVETMYAAGVRTFVELGPGRVLTGLVRRTLGTRPHRAMSADGGLRNLLESIAGLHAAGHPADVSALFEGRPVQWIDLDRLPDLPATAHGWWIDGGRVWADGDTSRTSGIAPFLDADSPAAPASLALAVPAGGVPLTEFYRQYEETMRRFLDQQERMLDQVLGLASGEERPRRADRPAIAAHTVAATAPRTAPDRSEVAATDRDSLVGRLVQIVGDRTGYANDAIGVDLDLEADLGIDSIKRVEIIATFANTLAEPDARRLQAELDRLTRLRTLNAIGAASAAALARAHEPQPSAAADVDGECPRFVMESVEDPLDGSPKRRLSGLHLVTAGGHDISPHVIEALTRQGAVVGEIAMRDLLDGARLSARVARLREQCGPVRGVMHLAPLGRPPADGADVARAEFDATTLSLFAVLKSVAADLTSGPSPAVVLAATAMGGSWGRDGCRPGGEQAAGCHGLLRSLEREYPQLTTIVVDVDEARPASELAGQLVREYLAADQQEVGYHDGCRWTRRLTAAPLANRPVKERAWKPAAGWVVLATGGARGITAEICDELAAPGVRFVLIGRSTRGDDPAVDAERRRTVDRLLAAGAEVELLRVDVGDDAAFGAAIDGIYRKYGRIDAVLHGAGAIRDQRFELKTVDDFDHVFRAKVGGALTLSRHLRAEGLRWVVLFGSVSGRFGNPGQTDYAAANEVLNRLAWSLHRRWPDTRVMTINWGPWRGVGMAGDAALALMKARGIQAIDPPAGRRFLVDELRAGALDDVEVIAGAGPWADRDAQSTARLRSTLNV